MLAFQTHSRSVLTAIAVVPPAGEKVVADGSVVTAHLDTLAGVVKVFADDPQAACTAAAAHSAAIAA